MIRYHRPYHHVPRITFIDCAHRRPYAQIIGVGAPIVEKIVNIKKTAPLPVPPSVGTPTSVRSSNLFKMQFFNRGIKTEKTVGFSNQFPASIYFYGSR